MKAVVKNVVREEHPRTDSVSGVGVSTQVIAIEVDYLHDNGDLYCSQRYAYLPEELQDLTIFDRQAYAFQVEIDEAVRQTQAKNEEVARLRPVDDKVASLRNHFKLNLGDQIPINDRM
jgi:hypothetical protein